jgi:hypothetical protein
MVAAHDVKGDCDLASHLGWLEGFRRRRGACPLLFDLFGLGELSNLAASVKTLGGDMMASMHLPGNRVDRQRRPLQGIMCSTHITPGRRLA